MFMMLQQTMKHKELLSSFLEVPDSFHDWIGDKNYFVKYNEEEAKKIYQKNYNPNNFGIIFKSFNITDVSISMYPIETPMYPGNSIFRSAIPQFDISGNGSGFSELFFGSKNECKNIILSLLGNRSCVVNFSPIYSFKDGICLKDYSIALK